MIQYSVFMYALRASRYFQSIQINPQSFAFFCHQPHRIQETQRPLQIRDELRQAGSRFYKSQIDIAQIMVHCSPTGKTTGNIYPLPFRPFLIDFRL